jgi:hypothetical protein
MGARVRVHAWVPPHLLAALRDQAASEQTSISHVVCRVLERAIIHQQHIPSVSEAAAMAVEREVRKQSNRLANLAARAAIAAEAARILTATLLARQVGQDQARRLSDAAWNRAVERLRTRLEEAGIGGDSQGQLHQVESSGQG